MSDLVAENEHWLLLAEENGRDFLQQIRHVDDPDTLHAVIALLVEKSITDKKAILDIIAEDS